MTPRQFFFAPIVLPRYNRLNGQKFLVGAASHKVSGMAAGMRSQATRSVIVSSPIVTASTGPRYFSAFTCRDQRLACAYLPAISIRGLNRVFSAFAYLGFAMRHIKREDRVVLYNFFPEYVLAAAFLRLRFGRDHVVMDLEDGPRADERTTRGYVNRLSLRLLMPLCSPRTIVVSRQLAEIMRLDEVCVVNGVSPEPGPRRAHFGSPIVFLYGGSIESDTGLDLFVGALRTLARTRPELAPHVHFVVTGYGGGDTLRALAAELVPAGFRLDVRQDIGPEEYRQALADADVGLSLRLPDTSMTNTTFPSNVIELASLGLLVLTTDISDISVLFDAQTAAILRRADASGLADLIASIALDPSHYERVAAAGQQRIADQCSRRSVGKQLVEFLGRVRQPKELYL
jgi:glycosyltransferase involved in cell wall biosynthesis